MPRLSRTVFVGVPHHVTQRGNRREDIFFVDEDRVAYLSWLKEYCEKFEVEILAYCLMTNHIHLVAVPAVEDWSAWLSGGDEADEIHVLRRNVEKGLPCGSAGFVQKLGRRAGRLLEYRPQ